MNVAAVAADRALRDRRAIRRPPNIAGAATPTTCTSRSKARWPGATAPPRSTVSRQYRETYMSGAPDPRTQTLGTATFYAAGLHGDVGRRCWRRRSRRTHSARRSIAMRAGEALARRGRRGGGARRGGGDRRAAHRPGRAGTRAARRPARRGLPICAGGARGDAGRQFRRRPGRLSQGDGRGSSFPNSATIRRSSGIRCAAASPRRRLAAGDAQSARAQLYASLRRWPNDALALYALSQADRAAGDAASADRNLARARRFWAGDVTQVPLARI